MTQCMQTLLPDVVAPEAYQNDCSYVRELSGNMNCELLSHFHGRWLQGDLEKPPELSKLGGGCLRWDGHLPGTIWYNKCSFIATSSMWYPDGIVTLGYFTVYAVVECH